MIGAIIGDIVGSVYEWHNIKTKEFELFPSKSFFTDDTVMTVAVTQALMNADLDDEESVRAQTVNQMRRFGRQYPNAGYGLSFRSWMFSTNPIPYNSWGNGSAMRVSAAGWLTQTLDDAVRVAKNTAEVTHNHPEGINGAQATTAAIYLARNGFSTEKIRSFIQKYYYNVSFTLDEIRLDYQFNEKCHETVPQSIVAFLESTNFEDAIRNAVSIGGDSDTLAAITGSIAEAYYGVPEHIKTTAMDKLTPNLRQVVTDFNKKLNIQ